MTPNTQTTLYMLNDLQTDLNRLKQELKAITLNVSDAIELLKNDKNQEAPPPIALFSGAEYIKLSAKDCLDRLASKFYGEEDYL